jgi:hypothetical protein
MSTTIRTATEAATPATGFSAQIGATLFRVRLALLAILASAGLANP